MVGQTEFGVIANATTPLPSNQLRGLGAALAVRGWKRSASPRGPAKDSRNPPLRSLFVFMPNGVNPANFTPKGTGEKIRTLAHAPTAGESQDDIFVLENLYHKKTDGRNGQLPKVPAFLHGGMSCAPPGRDLDVGGPRWIR